MRWYLSQPRRPRIGVTGPIPAEYDQSQIIGKDIWWVELFTVLAIALIVGLRFRWWALRWPRWPAPPPRTCSPSGSWPGSPRGWA